MIFLIDGDAIPDAVSCMVTHAHICMVTHIASVWINRVRLPILVVVGRTGKINISLSAFAPENLISRLYSSGDGTQK